MENAAVSPYSLVSVASKDVVSHVINGLCLKQEFRGTETEYVSPDISMDVFGILDRFQWSEKLPPWRLARLHSAAFGGSRFTARLDNSSIDEGGIDKDKASLIV
jgi:hypothetical protein